MSEGRGSASMNMIIVISLLCILVIAENTNAETHKVGGPKGWTFGMVSWPNGKTFKAGDVLVFDYNAKLHNLVAVDEIGYKRCKTPAGAQVLRTGHEEIELASGANYFICNVPGHCQTGMKISINVA
ncbi:hypothetical protein P8452_27798 [Trifolium repens]|nr:basic blue protein [Trifolium repens]WJX40309.1 hypothetical protein P8452_27798 [Trifolium repens]